MNKVFTVFGIILSIFHESINAQSYAVGQIRDEFAVSQTGAATYQLPLELPEGKNGFTPALSVTYSSQAGEGLLGYGFTLAGLSVISKVPKTFYNDGVTAGINFELDNRIAIDGNRLIYSGTAAANPVYDVYTPENQNFMRVKKFPGYFVTETKQGIKTTYNVLHSVSSTNGNSAFQGVLAWYPDSITDEAGNLIKITYYNYTNEAPLVNTINYSGNTIVFTYETLSSSPSYYINGVKIKRSKRIKTIHIKAGSNITLKTYQFSYEGNTHDKNKLKGIRVFGINGTELPPISIEWGFLTKGDDTNLAGNRSKQELTGPLADPNKIIYYGDYNGDGMQDLLVVTPNGTKQRWHMYLNNQVLLEDEPLVTGYQMVTYGDLDGNHHTFYPCDYDGDGITDLIRHVKSTTKTTFLKLTLKKNTNGYYMSNGGTLCEYDSRIFHLMTNIDLDGDKKNDYIVFERNNGTLDRIYKIILSTGDNPPTNLPLFNYYYIQSSKVLPLDFNGDGVTDISWTYNDKNYIFTYSFAEKIWKTIRDEGYPTRWHEFIYGDFNGDGNDDILSFVNNTWEVALSTGRNYFTASSSPALKFPIQNPDDFKIFSIRDMDGDGKDDVVIGKDSTSVFMTLRVYFSNGDGTFTNPTTQLADIPSGRNYHLGDFLGEGVNNVFIIKNHISHHSFIDWMNKKEISTITNGDITTKVVYGFLPKLTSYTADNSTNPTNIISFNGGIRVVKEFWKSAPGNDYFHSVYFNYKGAKIHRYAGFLGFKEIIKHTSLGGHYYSMKQTDTYEFLEHFPLLKVSEIREINEDKLIRTTSISNSVTPSLFNGMKTWLHKVTETIETDHLNGVTVKNSNLEFDQTNGNVLRSRKIVQGFIEENTVMVYKAVNSFYKNKLESILVTKSILGHGDTKSTVFEYYGNGQIKMKTENGVTTNYAYYSDGNLHTETVTAIGSTGSYVTTYAYYDINGKLKSVTDPRGHKTEYEYHSTGNLHKEITHNGNSTEYPQYDGFGNPTVIKSPTGVITTISREWATDYGKVKITKTTPGAGVSISWYDVFGNEIRTETSGFNGTLISSCTYDPLGQPLVKTLPHYDGEAERNMTNCYYPDTRLHTKTQAGVTTTITYEPLRTISTNPVDTIITQYNPQGNPIQITRNGQTIQYTYYADGKAKTATPHWGGTVTMNYNQWGYQDTLTDPSSGKTYYQVNAIGLLLQQRLNNGESQQLTYDPFGRILRTQEPNFSVDYNYETVGGGIGMVKSLVVNNSFYNTFTYDAYGRVLTNNMLGDGTRTFSYTHDALNNIKTIKYPTSNYTIENVYNPDGFLQYVKIPNGANICEVVKVNSDGNVTEINLGSQLKTFRNFDPYGFPESIITTKGNDTLQYFEYYFDNVTGNLIFRKDNLKKLREDFGYDYLDRLETVTDSRTKVTRRFSYDENGNIVNFSQSGQLIYNNPRNIYAVTNVDGPLVNQTVAQNITYTTFGQPKIISTGNTRIEYEYAPDKTRRKMSIYENNTLKEWWVYFGSFEQRVIVSGNKVTRFHYIQGPDGPVAVYLTETGQSAKLYYILKDHLGSVTALVNSNGVVAEEYSYDAWGKYRNPLDWTYNNLPANRIINRGYTFHEHLNMFGLIHMNGRMYDPSIGRFLSPDNNITAPQLPQNYNRYSYCLNNPMKYVDPSGEDPIIITSIIVGGLFTAWMGGTLANGGNTDPTMWEYNESTCNMIIAGAVLGGLSFYMGASALTSAYAFNFSIGINLSGMVTAGANFIVGNGAVILQGIGYTTVAGGGAFVAVGAYKQHQEKNRQSNYPGARRERINMQGGNVINQAVDWVGYMSDNQWINPETGRRFHMSDMIDGSTIPYPSTVSQGFGGLRNSSFSGIETFDGVSARWYIVDRNFMDNYPINYVNSFEEVRRNEPYRIFLKNNGNTRFSISTYDYELFQKWIKKINSR